MFSPEEQQIEICFLKSNLEEIENDLVVQRSALPELAAENEKKYRETMAALHVVQALNSEMERLKLESMRLTAKHMQSKKQCQDVTACLEKARENRKELVNLLKEGEQAIETEIRKYEESLREKADRFRKTRNYYNEEEIKNELEIINQEVIKLEIEGGRQRRNVKEVQKELMSLSPDLPEDILAIVGKDELDAELKTWTEKSARLRETRDRLLKLQRVYFKIQILK